MSERKGILLASIGIMAAVALSAATIAIYVLYNTAFEARRGQLNESVRNHAHMVESVAKHVSEKGGNELPGGAGAATLRHIVEAPHKHFLSFGETGEFALARLDGEQIIWLLSEGRGDAKIPAPTPFDSSLAEPMRRALRGESGTVIGLDYRGERVLAAYRPVSKLGWGVVAKIDIAEIRRPFLRAGGLAAGIALVVVALGVGFVLRVTSPLIQRVEARTQELREAHARLESRVAERTSQLSAANRSLSAEIQERARTEVELRRMSMVFMDSVCPILIEDLSGRIVDLNAEAERTYGWSRDELLGQPIQKLVPPEQDAPTDELRARCRRGERVRHVEGLRQTKSGELVPVLLSLSLLTDDAGRPLGIATIDKDITAQKQTETALRGERDFAEGLIETAPVIVLVLDPEGRIVRFNRYMEEFCGYRLNEVMGKDWFATFLPERNRDRIRELFAHALSGVPTRGYVNPIVTRAGAEREIEWHDTTLEDGGGKVVGLLAVGQDITEQKRLARQLRAAASKAALAEERQRRMLAVDLHDGLGQLLALASIKLGMLRNSVGDYGLDPQVREVEQLIAEAHERTGSLTFQLSPPVLHDVGLKEAAQWLADDLERRYGLHVTLEDDGRRAPLDEGARITLFRSLSELLINVAKHARTDKAHVRLWREDRLMKIAVEDEGTGFDPDADTSGYGLFSIRERLNHLGGSMQIGSAPGGGTKIVLAAPIMAPAPDTARRPT